MRTVFDITEAREYMASPYRYHRRHWDWHHRQGRTGEASTSSQLEKATAHVKVTGMKYRARHQGENIQCRHCRETNGSHAGTKGSARTGLPHKPGRSTIHTEIRVAMTQLNGHTPMTTTPTSRAREKRAPAERVAEKATRTNPHALKDDSEAGPWQGRRVTS